MCGSHFGRAVAVVALVVCGTLWVSGPASAEIVRVGTAPFASLSGYVYADMNKTCALEVGEIVIPDVTITLTGVTEGGESVTMTTVTGPSGDYKFIKLDTGTYTLTETQPVEFKEGKYDERKPGKVNGAYDGTVSGPNAFTNITLVVGEAGTRYDFGEGGLRSAYVSKRQFLTYTEEPTEYVPEPAAALLLAAGALALVGSRRRRAS